jgi:hypothetical protein
VSGNSEFFDISSKALEEAAASTQFKLSVPDTARKDRDGTGDRWTEIVDIESLDAVNEPAKNRMYFEVAVSVSGDTFSPENIGKHVSKRFYVMREDATMTDGQKRMCQTTLARVQDLVKACGAAAPGKIDAEWIQYYFGFDSPLKGQKVVMEIHQHPRKDDPGRIDIDFARFLPYA